MSWPAPRSQRDTGRPFGDVARALLRRKRFAEKGRYSALTAAWLSLVGEGVAEHTRVASFKEGRLVVEVDSPTLLHELNGFLKESLLEGLQAVDAGRDVAQMELRLGAVRQDEDRP
jgi:predicted nucleic acid-binding Zn ribbon protein